MNTHWHAFAFTGYERPPDSQARDPQSAVMPNDVNMWFRKPASMREGTFTDADSAHAWLSTSLEPHQTAETALPRDAHLAAARDALERSSDAYVGYYSATGRFLVRAVLTCPRTGERCPDPPR